MPDITIHQLETNLAKRLEQRATEHGNTIEDEIKAILSRVLLPQPTTQIDLATAISQRFAPLGDLELPEITRDSMRTPPNFD